MDDRWFGNDDDDDLVMYSKYLMQQMEMILMLP